MNTNNNKSNSFAFALNVRKNKTDVLEGARDILSKMGIEDVLEGARE